MSNIFLTEVAFKVFMIFVFTSLKLAVGIAHWVWELGLRAGKLRSRSFQRQGIFISSQVLSLTLWPTQLLTEQLQREITLGIKWLVHETDLRPPKSVAGIKKE